MKHIILIAIVMTVMSVPAMADLRVVPHDTDVGKKCYDEEYTSYAAGRTPSFLYKTIGPSYLWDFDSYEGDRCPDSYDEWYRSPEGECWVGYDDSAIYVCAKRTDNDEAKKACEWASIWEITNEWMATDNNRVRSAWSITGQSVGNYTCNAVVEYEYGCAAGYYQSGGSGASMTCSKCPTPGTSEIGTTDITDCYVSGGSGYNDGTGTFNVSGTCWYQN